MGVKNLKSKEEQLKAIKHGRGIQYILDEARKIFGNPILIFDMEYKLIAFTNTDVNDDPIWNEFMTHGALGTEIIEFFKNEGFIDEVANSTLQNGVTFLISDKLKYNRIFGQLFNKNNIPVADLVSVECETPFEDNASELIGIICNVLSEELGNCAYYRDYGQAYQENILKKLIQGNIEDKRIYTGHIANIDKTLKEYIFVAVADIALCDPEYMKLVYFRDLFKRTQSDFKYYIYGNYIVMLMSSNDKALDKKDELSQLRRIFERENICVGISSVFENLFELQQYYAEAVTVLNDGLKVDSNQRIFWHS